MNSQCRFYDGCLEIGSGKAFSGRNARIFLIGISVRGRLGRAESISGGYQEKNVFLIDSLIPIEPIESVTLTRDFSGCNRSL